METIYKKSELIRINYEILLERHCHIGYVMTIKILNIIKNMTIDRQFRN